ncbi:homocysteine S-methyltransferase family protein [Candidatus Woesearchaeota archaeon]|nr:homocysteine S-methyltransferase family protein [Candidatus Woesearchaeota archaeon]
MGRLAQLLRGEKLIFLSGPYGTQVAERVARDKVERPQRATNIPDHRHIGAACSALLTDEGQAYLREIASDYMKSVPMEQHMVLVTPSFRLAKQTLEAAASVRGVDPNLPKMGLELCLDSINLCLEEKPQIRPHATTLLAMSIGPPFDCYRGEDTPPDVDNKYLPQVFVAVRFSYNKLDYLMFETVPSLSAALGAVNAFNQAHQGLNIPESLGNFQRVGTIQYLGNTLANVKLLHRDAALMLCPTYRPNTRSFEPMHPYMDYVISLCLEQDGTLNGVPLDSAIQEIFAKSEGQIQPLGIGINCNSPDVTEEALSSLSPESLRRVIGIHPNASSERNPRNYANMTQLQQIKVDEYVRIVKGLVERFNLKIVGGCCGTNEVTMRELHTALAR